MNESTVKTVENVSSKPEISSWSQRDVRAKNVFLEQVWNENMLVTSWQEEKGKEKVEERERK